MPVSFLKEENSRHYKPCRNTQEGLKSQGTFIKGLKHFVKGNMCYTNSNFSKFNPQWATMILLLDEWRWAWLHAWWVLRWLLNTLGALNSCVHCGHGCSCCPGDGGLHALSWRSCRFWMAFRIRSFSYSMTPEWTLLHQAGWSDARSPQALGSMPHCVFQELLLATSGTFSCTGIPVSTNMYWYISWINHITFITSDNEYNIIWFKYDRQKKYTHPWDSNSRPPDHNIIFYFTQTSVLTTRPSVTEKRGIIIGCVLKWREFRVSIHNFSRRTILVDSLREHTSLAETAPHTHISRLRSLEMVIQITPKTWSSNRYIIAYTKLFWTFHQNSLIIVQ